MIQNYFKIAFRNVLRHKGFTLINVTGLSVGMALCILIMLWVQDELSYDRFHENTDSIYRVLAMDIDEIRESLSAGSPSPVGPALVDNFAEIKKFTRVQSGWSGWHFNYNEKTFMAERLACADPGFFQIFKFKFIKGNPETALKDRYSMVLTETLARKIFGNDEPMGKIIKKNNTDMLITGIIEDIPANSHLQFDYIFPIINMTHWRESKIDSWDYTQFATYLEVDENADVKVLNQKIAGFVKKNNPESKITISLQSLKDIHLHSAGINSWMIVYPNPGNINFILIFSVIAICILLLACINFMNLSTAKSVLRTREIGVRKVAGAHRKDLLIQFFGETILFAVISFFIAILIVEISIQSFNSVSGKNLTYSIFHIGTFLWSTVIVVLTGIISGIYPALFLSSYQPVQTLAKLPGSIIGHKGSLRKALVVIQFSFTIILVFCTITIFRQLQFIQNKDLGFEKENIVYFAGYGQYGRDYESSKNELLTNSDIISICNAFPPGRGFRGTSDVDWEGKDPSNSTQFFTEMVDYDYLETFGMKMVDGRYYSREYATDSDNYVINEAAVEAMGIVDPVGKKFVHNGEAGTIIGVVKNFHGGSLHHPIRPKVMKFTSEGFFICVRFRPGKTREVLGFLEEKWGKFVPGFPFRYNFLNESIDNYYKTEKQVSEIIQYFTILAIFIACLGLFGLASFMAERKTKEIGIRKVLGAQVSGIVFLLTGEFSRWVIIASCIALPVGWYIMKGWLEDFAYRIEIDIWTYFISVIFSLFVAILTVGYQSIKVALANPIEALRYE
jgi:ABC-type antimicrobial peptide transport system permease subunit